MALTARRPLRFGPFRIPREGGVYGVWTASLIFGLAWAPQLPTRLLVTWLAGSTLTLLLVERVRFEKSLPAIVPPILLFLPLILSGLPATIILSAAGIALLAAALNPAKPIYGIISGGILLSLHGVLVPAAFSQLPASSAALSHEAAAVVQASIAVTRGSDRSLYKLMALTLSSMLLASASLALSGSYEAALLLAGDALLRAAATWSGAVYRLKLKVYGMLETLHSTTIMLLVPLLIK